MRCVVFMMPEEGLIASHEFGLDYQKQMRLQSGLRALVATGTHVTRLSHKPRFCLELL